MKIRRLRPLAPLALAIALAACNPMKSGDSAPTLKLDDTAQGEITSSSTINYNDGSRHQRYSLPLKAGDAVALDLSGALEGQLAIFEGNALMARTGASHEGMYGASEQTSLAFKAPRDATYVVAVSGDSDQSFGPFRLKTTPIKPYDGAPLGADSQVIDWLTGEKQEYTLKVEKAGIYTIAMESTDFDTFLRLNGKGVELENDDSSNGLNARITAFLEPGEYTITGSSVGGRTGAFNLKVSMTAAAEGAAVRDGVAITVGQPVHGLIDSSGRRVLSLRVAQATQVQFDAVSDSLDTVLQISGPGVDAENDDAENGTNAQLTLQLVPGNYTVTVRSLGGNQGPFELQTVELGGNATRINNNQKDAAVEAAAAASAAADATAESTN